MDAEVQNKGIFEYTIHTFDWKFYINKYKDLRRCGILTQEAAFNHWIKFGIHENRQHKKFNDLYKKSKPIESSNKPIYEFIIQTTAKTVKTGILLKDILISINLNAICKDSKIILHNIVRKKVAKNIIFIFLSIDDVGVLPKNLFYIYSLKPHNYHYKNRELIGKAYQKCVKILDYSHTNMQYYPEKIRYKVQYLPIPSYSNHKQYNILFIGGKNRKTNFLDYLRRYTRWNILNGNNVTGKELDDLIGKSNLVLNLNNLIVETDIIQNILRINNNIIISEESGNRETLELYKNIIKFVPIMKDDLSNINIIIEQIEYYILKDKGVNKLNTYKIDLYRKTFKNYIKWEIIENFPFLFHKYKLNIIHPCDACIKYEIKHNLKYIKQMKSKYYAHLHCYNISDFNKIYNEYIVEIDKFFNVIITFSIGEIGSIPNHFVILKIPNKGMDIGGKFVMMDYLKKNKINCDFIFMLHSKKDKKRRNMYFKPFFKNLGNIVSNLNPDVGVCVPNIVHDELLSKYKINTLYVAELMSYLNINANDYIFPEGNCYIMNGTLAKKIFCDKKLYHCLNGELSFDVNWVKWYYNIKTNDIQYIYDKWKKNDLYGNYIQSKEGYKRQADGQIEHAFERIIFHICNKYKKNILIAPFD